VSDQFTLRTVEGEDDDERIRTVAESSMTASYALSPGDIETVVEAEFSESARATRREDDEHTTLVAETDDDVVAGFVDVATDEGTARRLHVDPERRGAGIGTALFERALSELDDRGVSDRRAVVIASCNTAGAFFERFDFEKVEERSVEIGGRETVEYVYVEGGSANEASADAGANAAADDQTAAESADLDLPDTIEEDGDVVHLGDDPQAASEAPFVQTYLDEDRTDPYGYYCANCGSTDVSMDSMERLVCGNCGNTRKPDESYDGAYL
jgi:predicted N-acetyltransferase YhbS/ribosomal protein S27AE